MLYFMRNDEKIAEEITMYQSVRQAKPGRPYRLGTEQSRSKRKRGVIIGKAVTYFKAE